MATSFEDTTVIPSLRDDIQYASQTDSCVMLTGETGVGKRSVADMIHHLSPRRRGPFVVVTGADALGSAAIAAAQDGTLLIQELETLTAAAQRQLLRCVDRQTGSCVNVRFMTATSVNLFDRVQAGTFCDDLFYRLNIIHLVIQPLRERPEDIPVMFHHYLSLHSPRRARRLSTAARRRLIEYPWPGNIAELKTVTLKLSADDLPDVIEPEHLPINGNPDF